MTRTAGRLGARELIDLVLDDGTFESWDTPPRRGALDPEYASRIAAAERRTGLDESIVSGAGSINGRRVAVVVGEFAFLAGSVGIAAATRLAVAIRRATAEGLPLLAAPASGGTRMQEGTAAFVQMVAVTAAVVEHKAAGLPYLVYLRHPTTGGVLASWASLGHITVGEPGALIGFLGPRVYEALAGAPFPPGIQVSEHLFSRGLIDAVLPPDRLASIVDRVLGIIDSRAGSAGSDAPELPEPSPVDAWTAVERSRRIDRPGVRELLRFAGDAVVPLSGTGQGERDRGLLLALATFGGAPCVVLGQDRRGQQRGHLLGPGGLREARRGMRLAAELGIPLLTVIDTPGAVLSPEAEEGGLAGEIARCLEDLATLRAPTVTLLLGEGTGGGALALLPADRILAAQHAWLAPLPPEGSSAIVHRSVDHAADMARAQGITAADLLRSGIVDLIVPELPDAADEPADFCARVGRVLAHELSTGSAADPTERASRRSARFQMTG